MNKQKGDSMERLTKENVKEMNMLELSHNQVFVRDGWAWYRDYDREVSAVSLVKEMFARNGIEYPTDQEEFGDYMLELLADGYETIDGMIAMIYRLIWSMADVREALKSYEDTGLTPEEIKGLINTNKNLVKQNDKQYKELQKAIKDRDYWKAEALKHCAKLGEIKLLVGRANA
jgi:hypothetical protein